MYTVKEKKDRIVYDTVGGNKIVSLMHITADTAENIPVAPENWAVGSRCDVLEENGSVYELSNSREWKKVNFYNQGSEDGGIDPDNYYTKPQTDSIVAAKVDKVTGKGLSTEDFTTAEKTKLAGIETSATHVGQTIPAGTEYSIAGGVYTVGANAEIFNDYTNNKAIGINAHAEGGNNTALGNYAHAEGNTTEAYGAYTHAEGNETRAYGLYSHAEGKNTWTNGTSSHAEGHYTMANYANSHSEGMYTVANSECQHVQGKYNRSDQNNKYAFIIGNGTDRNSRSNAFAVDWNGLVYVCDSETGINLNTLASGMNNKVDKITGKGLSTNDYTNAEKTKLGELSTASVTIDLNSQSWTQSANGLFYSANISISNLLEVYSVIITGFSALKTTDNVTPISNTGRTAIRLTASTDTFSNQASITVSVFGRFSTV